MDEIKFVKFGSLESKKYLEKKFAGIKESDLVYVEDNGNFSIAYIVTAIDDKEIELVSILDSFKEYYDIDEKVKNALNSISDFTIYAPAVAKKEAVEEKKVEEKKAVSDDFEELEIVRKCGHKETVKIKKTHDQEYRAWLIHDEEKKLCRSCWEAEAKEKAKAAKKAAKESGLPALKGSAKQKKWAETIRAEKLAMLAGDPTMGAVWAWYAQNYTKAAEWIDARFMDEYQLKRNMEQLKRNMEMKLRFKR